MPEIYIPNDDLGGASHGEKVIVRMTSWDIKKQIPYGEAVEVLGAERENDLAMKQLLMQNGFPLHFSDEALEESARMHH